MPDPGVLSGPGSLVVLGMDRRSRPTLGLSVWLGNGSGFGTAPMSGGSHYVETRGIPKAASLGRVARGS